MNEKRIRNARQLIQGLWETGLVFPGDRSRLMGEMRVIEDEILRSIKDGGSSFLDGEDMAHLLRAKSKLEGFIESYMEPSETDKTKMRDAMSDFLREIEICLKKLRGVPLDEGSIKEMREVKKKLEEKEKEKGPPSLFLPPGVKVT